VRVALMVDNITQFYRIVVEEKSSAVLSIDINSI